MQHWLVFQNLDYSEHSLLSSFATAAHCCVHHAHLAKMLACPTVTAVAAAEVLNQNMSKLCLNLAASSSRTRFAASMRLVLSYLPSGGPSGLTIESVFVGGKCDSVSDLTSVVRRALTKLALGSQ